MEHIETPDFMPVLSMGGHASPEGGACVMEYISFVTGDKWTDVPQCTPVQLAYLAQMTNDYQPSNAIRSERMTPLIPRLIGAGRSEAFDELLLDWLYRKAQVSVGEHGWAGVRGELFELVCLATRRREDALHESEWAPRLVTLLIEALDLYDEFLGRETPAPLSEENVQRLNELTEIVSAH